MKFVGIQPEKKETTKCFQQKKCSERTGCAGDRRAEKAIEDNESVQR